MEENLSSQVIGHQTEIGVTLESAGLITGLEQVVKGALYPKIQDSKALLRRSGNLFLFHCVL
jgi:hypothetical protein